MLSKRVVPREPKFTSLLKNVAFLFLKKFGGTGMQQNEQWTTKHGFILASAGSAIGLGAIWKLPYVTGTSGGGAIIL